MQQRLFTCHCHDLTTPDGFISSIEPASGNTREAIVTIEAIPKAFLGFHIEQEFITLNGKSTIAQLGIEVIGKEYEISPRLRSAKIKVELIGIGTIGLCTLALLDVGMYIGKLFAADPERRVRDPDYLLRMFGRSDRHGTPLLTLGGMHGSRDLMIEKVDGRTVAYLKLQEGAYAYPEQMCATISLITETLKHPTIPLRELIRIQQQLIPNSECRVTPGTLLLARTEPLHVRTVFGKVVDHLLPTGFKHTSASILQPDTLAAGDIYEFYGEADHAIHSVPLEFYTLEPYREYVFFIDRDQLQHKLEDPETLFDAFNTAPQPMHHKCATFIVKGAQLDNLKGEDWIYTESSLYEFPGLYHPEKQALLAEQYIVKQPSYPFLKAIEDELITSQGILLCRYLPTPLMKRFLLSENVRRCLKGIYFQYPSRARGEFFSTEDRSLLLDLSKFGIPIYWLEERTKRILQFVPKFDKDTGMFVPPAYKETFLTATMIGVYGSNLVETECGPILKEILEGLLSMKEEIDHPLLNKNKPLALVTGGGPGAMSVANKVAKSLGVLSCANVVDFASGGGKYVREQEENPYIDAKMTFQLEKLIERQSKFHLDLPIFVTGGIGTDFEYALEEIQRKIGVTIFTPILLLGTPEYWRAKISSRFKCNLDSNTITGTEWVSNSFYCVQTADQALKVYRDYFNDVLPIGRNGPVYKDGFKTVE